MTDVTEFTKVDIQQLQRLLGKPMMYKMFEMAKSVNIRANKVDPAVTGNLAGLDSAGDLVDSGLNIGDWLEPGDVSGTPGEITVTDNGDGTITISIPDNFLPSAISGTPNQITITDDGDGSITISIPTGANITFGSLGLKILDTNVTHALTIFLNSDLTASRTLFLVTGDSDRTLSLLGNLFVESLSRINQDLTTDANVLFNELEASSKLAGPIKTITQATTDTLTAAECAGTIISNYGQGAENTQTLPTAAVGLNGIVVIGTSGAGAFHLKAGASDKIYLDGTALDDEDKVSLATPAVGNFFTYFAFQTGASAYDWIVDTGEGTLTDGGP